MDIDRAVSSGRKDDGGIIAAVDAKRAEKAKEKAWDRVKADLSVYRYSNESDATRSRKTLVATRLIGRTL